MVSLAAASQRFMTLVAPDRPNSWEVDEVLEPLADHPHLDSILDQVTVIWPVSNALCYNFLGQAARALETIGPEGLGEWVREILDHYEEGGLRAAQRFMLASDNHGRSVGQDGVAVRLADIRGWLRPYAQAVSGRALEIEVARRPRTDTENLFLPSELAVLGQERDNRLLYTFLTAVQCAFVRQDSFFPDLEQPGSGPVERGEELARFAGTFARPDRALALYHLLEAIRVGRIFLEELPGLMRQTRDLRHSLAVQPDSAADLGTILPYLAWLPEEAEKGLLVAEVQEMFIRPQRGRTGATESCRLCRLLLPEFTVSTGNRALIPGEIRLAEIAAACRERQRRLRKQVVAALAGLLVRRPDLHPLVERLSRVEALSADTARLVIPDRNEKRTVPLRADRRRLLLDGQEVVLDRETIELVRRLEGSGGALGESEIHAAVGRAGQALTRSGSGGELESAPARSAALTYDEWDYRRQGFRKNWCFLVEKPLPRVQSSFVRTAMERHRGVIIRMRRKFEMMRVQERFVRRQRDGDEIDLDSLLDSLADARAGRAPSDRLFIRLRRDERDIAVLFLVDMSNSTAGWVGQVIKESLVVISEGLEILGDRYGIYGFSGMRRLRCEIFPVKTLDENSSEEVRQRIGAIAPREYTRMAPAIRHLSTLFAGVSARVRLLLILSDGKPEDYDGYAGKYAEEDTRHALLEARLAGIHSHCITVDRQAREYMARIFGHRGYTCISDVRRLPVRVPEIYRALTL